jgi:hypothetical protein
MSLAPNPKPGGPGPRIYITQTQLDAPPQTTPGFLSVVSYVLQDYRGGSRTRLHTGGGVFKDSFCNPILFAICPSTFSKLCEKRLQWHAEECSVALLL